MTFKDFTAYVAERYHVPKTLASNWTYAVIDALFDAIVDEDEVSLYGYGSFKHVTYKPLRNNFTSKDFNNIDYDMEWEIPSRMCIKFAPSARVKMAVRNGVASKDMRRVREGHDEYESDVSATITLVDKESDA